MVFKRLLIYLVIQSVGFCCWSQCSRWADSRQHPTPAELISFLQKNETEVTDKDCTIEALERLGNEKDNSSIPEVLKFLSLRRTFDWEQTRFIRRPVTELGHYPAAMALFKIGTPALPGLLEVIKQGSTDSIEVKNATATVMAIHRSDPSEGIRFLRNAMDKEEDPSVRLKLSNAIQKAPEHCSQSFREKCLAALKAQNP